MRTWVRAAREMTCGGNHDRRHPISEGELMLVIEHPGRRHLRCVGCAKWMFGEDPPELQDAPRTAQRRADFVTPRELWQFDPKLAQVGERDG